MTSPLDAPPPQVDGRVTTPDMPSDPRGVPDALAVRAAHDTVATLLDETAARRNASIASWQHAEDLARAQAEAVRLDEIAADPLNAQADALADENRGTMVDIGVAVAVGVPAGLLAGWGVVKIIEAIREDSRARTRRTPRRDPRHRRHQRKGSRHAAR